jgi:hypothetical protein
VNRGSTVYTFERPVTDYQVTRRHIPDKLSPQPYRRDEHKIRVRTWLCSKDRNDTCVRVQSSITHRAEKYSTFGKSLCTYRRCWK